MGDVRSAAGLIDKLPKAAEVLADTAYDSDKFREFLIARGSTTLIKPNPTRKHIPPFDKASYKGRNVIERASSHLKDWRRVATRYDKLARNFRATITLALLLQMVDLIESRVSWTPSVGQESGRLKRESHRVPTPLLIRGDACLKV
jgi:putative transposase